MSPAAPRPTGHTSPDVHDVSSSDQLSFNLSIVLPESQCPDSLQWDFCPNVFIELIIAGHQLIDNGSLVP